MKRFTANLTRKRLNFLVLLDMPLTIILPNELRPAIITRVRLNGFVSVHVSNVIGLPDEGPLAHIALERFGRARRVRPFVQLQVPLRRETLVADQARERLVTAVISDVHL